MRSGRINEVLDEIPRVREDMGYPPLVTPTSQIVGSQAVLNVLTVCAINRSRMRSRTTCSVNMVSHPERSMSRFENWPSAMMT
ncbi:MAG: hypothetical protein WDM70_09775 [Nitrosomonadales bacterium]